MDSYFSGYKQLTGSCEQGNEHWLSIRSFGISWWV